MSESEGIEEDKEWESPGDTPVEVCTCPQEVAVELLTMRCWRVNRLLKNNGEVCCQFSCGTVSPRDEVALGQERFMPRMMTTGAALVLRLLMEESIELCSVGV